MAPTRELSIQIFNVIKSLGSSLKQLKVQLHIIGVHQQNVILNN